MISNGCFFFSWSFLRCLSRVTHLYCFFTRMSFMQEVEAKNPGVKVKNVSVLVAPKTKGK